MRRVRVALVAIAIVSAFMFPASAQRPAASSPARRPNVVIILVDDLGWADIGPYGSRFHETPALDRLAAQGVRFTNFYAAGSVCSPTRASLMTGKYPARLGITDWIGGDDVAALKPPANVEKLPLEEVTIGEAFLDAGYATGYIGKWHLGTGAFMPNHQGFAFTKAVNGAGQPAAYFYPYRDPKWDEVNIPDLADGKDGEYLTDRLTDEAVRFIESNRARPFFLVLSHYAVHTPLQARQELKDKYAAKALATYGPGDAPKRAEHDAFTKLRQDNPTYAGMIDSTDRSVGRISETLDALKLQTNTIVVFVSDNGGLSTLTGARASAPTSNEPLRAGKGWLYEGGIRVPFIVSWPGVLRGGRVDSTVGVTTDVYPTLLEMAGLPLRPAQHVDGISLAPAVRGTGGVSRDAIYWHFPHYHGSGNRPSGAVRAGDWKLVEWFEDGRVELFNLAIDPSETRDVSASDPTRAAAMRNRLHQWRVQVGAKMPAPRKTPGQPLGYY